MVLRATLGLRESVVLARWPVCGKSQRPLSRLMEHARGEMVGGLGSDRNSGNGEDGLDSLVTGLFLLCARNCAKRCRQMRVLEKAGGNWD